jgi:UDP-N-acetylglucosamine 2-epimerase
LVDIGYNKLAGAGKKSILSSVEQMMNVRLNGSHDMYGDGDAAGKIVDAISKYL